MCKTYSEKKYFYYSLLEVFFAFSIPYVALIIGMYIKVDNFWSAFFVGGLLSVITLILLYYRDEAIRSGRGFWKGILGEKRVSKILTAKLEPLGYKILSNVKVRYGDVDFLVVGKSGVFCLEVKNIKGRISYDSQYDTLLRNGYHYFDYDPLKQVKGNAFDIHDKIKENLKIDRFVKPVLVFVSSGSIIDKIDEIGLVKVLLLNELADYLSQTNITALDDKNVETIANLYK